MSKKGLHPDFPVISGKYQMTAEWSCELSESYNKRFEDDSLVIWRPGLTFWIVVWGNDDADSRDERLEWIRGDASPNRFDESIKKTESVCLLTYKLQESPDVHAMYAFAISDAGHIQMAAYADDKEDLNAAMKFAESLKSHV